MEARSRPKVHVCFFDPGSRCMDHTPPPPPPPPFLGMRGGGKQPTSTPQHRGGGGGGTIGEGGERGPAAPASVGIPPPPLPLLRGLEVPHFPPSTPYCTLFPASDMNYNAQL